MEGILPLVFYCKRDKEKFMQQKTVNVKERKRKNVIILDRKWKSRKKSISKTRKK